MKKYIVLKGSTTGGRFKVGTTLELGGTQAAWLLQNGVIAEIATVESSEEEEVIVSEEELEDGSINDSEYE